MMRFGSALVWFRKVFRMTMLMLLVCLLTFRQQEISSRLILDVFNVALFDWRLHNSSWADPLLVDLVGFQNCRSGDDSVELNYIFDLQ